MAANTNRKGAGMKISMEVKYDQTDVAEIVMAAHVARFGDAPEGTKWSVSHTYSGKFEVTAVDANETEADSE
jgi:hypothetical protein